MLIGPQCTHSIPDSLQVFNRILSEFFDQHARFTTKRTNTNISPWLTVELKTERDYSDVLMYYYENFASRKQPKTMRNTNVRETKLIIWLKACWMKTPKTLLHSREHWKVYFPPNRNQNLLAPHSKYTRRNIEKRNHHQRIWSIFLQYNFSWQHKT